MNEHVSDKLNCFRSNLKLQEIHFIIENYSLNKSWDWKSQDHCYWAAKERPDRDVVRNECLRWGYWSAVARLNGNKHMQGNKTSASRDFLSLCKVYIPCTAVEVTKGKKDWWKEKETEHVKWDQRAEEQEMGGGDGEGEIICTCPGGEWLIVCEEDKSNRLWKGNRGINISRPGW